jgi:hypothetical protein
MPLEAGSCYAARSAYGDFEVAFHIFDKVQLQNAVYRSGPHYAEIASRRAELPARLPTVKGASVSSPGVPIAPRDLIHPPA